MDKPIFNNKPNFPIVCKETGKTYWISRSVAVTLTAVCVLKSTTYVLISKRGNAVPDFKDHWCMPCGYLDFNETLSDAVKRESWEEVGLNIDSFVKDPNTYMLINYIDTPWDIQSDPKKSNRENISIRFGFLAVVNEDLPKLIPNNDCPEPDEVSDAKWVNIKTLSDYNFAFNHDEHIKKFINMYA